MDKLIVAFLLIFQSGFSFTSLAQKPKEYQLKYNTKQNQEICQFSVLDEIQTQNKFKKDRIYFWLKSQEIIETQGGAGGRLLHGEFQAFYENKQLSKKGTFKKGLKDGQWIYWNPKGEIIHVENWSNGLRKGDEDFFQQGKLSHKIRHKGKKQIIMYPDSVLLFKNNDLRKKTLLHQKKITRVNRYKQGKLHGKQQEVNNGKKAVFRYRKGEKLFVKNKQNQTSKKKENKPEREKKDKKKVGLKNRIKALREKNKKDK